MLIDDVVTLPLLVTFCNVSVDGLPPPEPVYKSAIDALKLADDAK
jgi:hypothetical protein